MDSMMEVVEGPHQRYVQRRPSRCCLLYALLKTYLILLGASLARLLRTFT